MVREVVVHGDAVHGAAHFEAALHAAELGERREADVHRHARVPRGGERGERVQAVVAAVLRASAGQRTMPCGALPA